MKPFIRKKVTSYLRILALFERELKNYHPSFSKDDYYLNYILYREPFTFTNDIQIKVMMVLMRRPTWGEMKNDSENLKKNLEKFSRYFSVSDVSVVRQCRTFFSSSGKQDTNTHQTTNIEDRVVIQLSMPNERWAPIN
jgi:hypothetical protein